MSEYGYNNLCLLKDGKPWFPVMGEIHYSRYDEKLWEESLRKMKAGGLDIVSCYSFWIHHEEIEGEFDFEGVRSLRGFLTAAKNVDIKIALRIGPWCHGECRNGGFPDWLVKKEKAGELKLRINDEKYLAYVRKYWEELYKEAEGFFEKDGGPVMMVQIENEYGHVGGHRGEVGEAHMIELRRMAKEIGFDVPIYTATGWGGAVIGDCIPVMGGYCEAPWNQSIDELKPNTNYIISHTRNDALIACDHHVEGAVSFDESKYPYLTAELGGGLQVTEHRRPVASGTDIGAMSLTKLASGVGLLGYYMYHGGSNPDGKLSTLEENKETGYANNLPVINYDFNAPIRQYGTISDNFKEIKLYATFLKDFGEDMAALPAEIIPDFVKPEDMHTLRTSFRHDKNHGYVFFNNYQRRHTMDAHPNTEFTGICDNPVKFPAIDIESGEYAFFPYNMKLGNTTLVSALATPFCKLENGDDTVYVFYGDREPKYVFDGPNAKILHLKREQALNAYKIKLDKEYLVIARNYAWEENGKLVLIDGHYSAFKTYPELTEVPEGFKKAGVEGMLTIYQHEDNRKKAKASFNLVKEDDDTATYEICIDYPEKLTKVDRDNGRDTLLWFDYAADKMELYLDGKMINDYFHTGQIVPLSLGYFGFPNKLTAKVTKLTKDTYVFLEKWPEMINGEAKRINTITVEEQYKYI